MIAGRAPAGTRQDSGRVSVKHDLIKTTVPGARQGLMLQSHCTFGPSRRLRSNPVAPVERILGGLRILRFFYLHRGVIPVGQVVPWLITVLSRVKTFRKTQVFTGCSRCPPGVLPVFRDELVPPRYGIGVFQEDHIIIVILRIHDYMK